MAFSGHEYIRSEWRDVPAGFEDQAKNHPLLDTQPSLKEIRTHGPTAPGLAQPPVEKEAAVTVETAEPPTETESAEVLAEEPPAEESQAEEAGTETKTQRKPRPRNK